MSFGKAFAAARKEKGPGATFTYNGKKYSTNTKEDLAKGSKSEEKAKGVTTPKVTTTRLKDKPIIDRAERAIARSEATAGTRPKARPGRATKASSETRPRARPAEGTAVRSSTRPQARPAATSPRPKARPVADAKPAQSEAGRRENLRRNGGTRMSDNHPARRRAFNKGGLVGASMPPAQKWRS